MRTAEQILETKNWSMEYPNFMQESEILDAMDEYAKEVAIDFAIFIGKCMDGKAGPMKAFMNWEEMWNLYQQEKSSLK